MPYLTGASVGNVGFFFDGDNVNILPTTDDAGTISIGDGALDIDLKVFMGTTADYTLVDISAATITLVGAVTAPHKVNALTTNTVLSNTHFNGVITNRGAAGALNHTIPNANAALAGMWFEYRGVADQNQTFTAPTADTLITLNDATSDSIAWSTALSRIGSHGVFFCDGTNWFATSLSGVATIAT